MAKGKSPRNPMTDKLQRGAASTTMLDVAPTFIQSPRAARALNIRTACLSPFCRGVGSGSMPPLAHRSLYKAAVNIAASCHQEFKGNG